MTIRKGEEWGRRDIVPPSFFIAEDDADAASQPAGTPFALCRGDMYNALGLPRLPVHHQECTIISIDALMCDIAFTNGSSEIVKAFSQVAIGSWWNGRHIIATNSGFSRGLHIAPRSHPNDGEFDIVMLGEKMPLRQRFIAKRKAKTGTHVPHPDITIKRASSCLFSRERPQERLSIDGVAVSNWTSVAISIESDFWEVIV